MEAAQAEVGLNLATYEQCAGLLGAIAEQAPWAKTAAWYQEASSAFILAAAEERLRLRGDRVSSWLQVRVEAQAVQETLEERYGASGTKLQNNPKLLEFWVAIGEAITPVRTNTYNAGRGGN